MYLSLNIAAVILATLLGISHLFLVKGHDPLVFPLISIIKNTKKLKWLPCTYLLTDFCDLGLILKDLANPRHQFHSMCYTKSFSWISGYDFIERSSQGQSPIPCLIALIHICHPTKTFLSISCYFQSQEQKSNSLYHIQQSLLLYMSY